MDQEYVVFLAISGALGKLVVVASIIERVLAFIFEHDWFIRIATKECQIQKIRTRISAKVEYRG